MSDMPINKMDFKQLRNEVQELRDELALFKRKYQDAIYNLDSSNFGRSFTLEQNGLKAQIKIAADAVKTMVSDTDLQSELEKYSTLVQTAEAIQAVVSKSANLSDAEVITSLDQATDVGRIYVIQSKEADGTVIGEKYYYFNDITNSWELLSGESIHTVFSQTAEGFSLKGNVLIDGDTVITRNLKLSGNVTWDMDNSPVMTQYSSDNVNWHSSMEAGDMYMQMSFDGGKNWSTSTKVVGTDGTNGTNADVTPQNVFDALTDNGASQGIFAAFVNNDNKIYINTEFLSTKIADVADSIYIGDYDTFNEQKTIHFNNQAKITTFPTGVGHNGLTISANGIRLLSPPTGIYFTDPDDSASYISLKDYVAENAGPGGGTVVAVFGE